MDRFVKNSETRAQLIAAFVVGMKRSASIADFLIDDSLRVQVTEFDGGVGGKVVRVDSRHRISARTSFDQSVARRFVDRLKAQGIEETEIEQIVRGYAVITPAVLASVS